MKTQNFSQTKTERNNTIQILRAFAIIAVILIHTCPVGELQVFVRPFLNFATATFLFLSGYLTKTENENWGEFCRKRIARVVIPYIFWTILYSLPGLSHLGIGYLFRNLLNGHACSFFYFIFVYIQLVALTPLLCDLATSKYRIIGWLISPIAIILFTYYWLFIGTDLDRTTADLWSKSCLGWILFYYLGLLLGNQKISVHASLRTLSILYILSIPLQMVEGYGWFIFGGADCGTQLKISAILTTTLLLLIAHKYIQIKPTFNNKLLRLIGDYSFGIYLSHYMVILVLRKIPYYTTLSFPVTSALVLFISFGSCYIGSRLCGDRISKWLGLK